MPNVCVFDPLIEVRIGEVLIVIICVCLPRRVRRVHDDDRDCRILLRLRALVVGGQALEVLGDCSVALVEVEGMSVSVIPGNST